MLPCLHSCKKCIEKLAEKQEPKQALKCPTYNNNPTEGTNGVLQLYDVNKPRTSKRLLKGRIHALLLKFESEILDPVETTPTLNKRPTEATISGSVTGGSCPWMATADIYVPRATINKERKVKVIRHEMKLEDPIHMEEKT